MSQQNKNIPEDKCVFRCSIKIWWLQRLQNMIHMISVCVVFIPNKLKANFKTWQVWIFIWLESFKELREHYGLTSLDVLDVYSEGYYIDYLITSDNKENVENFLRWMNNEASHHFIIYFHNSQISAWQNICNPKLYQMTTNVTILHTITQTTVNIRGHHE